MYILLLTDLNNVSNFSWESVLLVCLYHVLDHGINYNQDNIEACMLL